VKGESPDAAVARRLARRISRGASGPLIMSRPMKTSGRSGEIQATRHLGAPYPSHADKFTQSAQAWLRWGRKKRRATPCPTPKPGPSHHGCLTC